MNGSSSVLLRGSIGVLTGLPGAAARHPGPDVRVAGGRIVGIGPLAPEPDERVIDAQDCVIAPAWVNTHHHLFQSLLKADPAGLNASLTPWLAATPYRFLRAFDEPAYRAAVRLGLVELALSGCGTVADHAYLYHPGQAFDPSAIFFEEARRLGLRAVLCRGGATLVRGAQRGAAGGPPPETLDTFLRDVDRLVHEWHQHGPDATRRIVMAPTTPNFSMTPAQMRECAAEARRLHILRHSHLAETVSYQDAIRAVHGMGVAEFMASIDWLGRDVWFAHLVHLTDEDVALLGATRTGIAHCPQSNARLGSGIAPVLALRDRGCPVSLGVDGAASNEAADFVSELRAAWHATRLKAGEASRAVCAGGRGEPGDTLVPVEEVVAWGSSGGADLLGLPDVGRVEVGACADLAVYDLGRDPRYFGHHDRLLAPITAGGTPRLRALLVGGETVVESGTPRGVDLAELAAGCATQVAGLVKRAAGTNPASSAA